MYKYKLCQVDTETKRRFTRIANNSFFFYLHPDQVKLFLKNKSFLINHSFVENTYICLIINFKYVENSVFFLMIKKNIHTFILYLFENKTFNSSQGFLVYYLLMYYVYLI